jgi:cytochrome c biogenesis factor
MVLNNILLSTATATVLLGTLYPLIREAIDGRGDLGRPALLQPDLHAAHGDPGWLILPAGPLLAWKRGDARASPSRLWPRRGRSRWSPASPPSPWSSRARPWPAAASPWAPG